MIADIAYVPGNEEKSEMVESSYAVSCGGNKEALYRRAKCSIIGSNCGIFLKKRLKKYLSLTKHIFRFMGSSCTVNGMHILSCRGDTKMQIYTNKI